MGVQTMPYGGDVNRGMPTKCRVDISLMMNKIVTFEVFDIFQCQVMLLLQDVFWIPHLSLVF